ncbi:MAG: transglycosylase SLT domain-containing protein [Chromatiales bacterium]|jgi:soluble lytic murein transglycosylase
MTRKRTTAVGLLAALLGLTALAGGVATASDPLASQRARFVEAERALAAGRDADLATLRASLKDYPLYPYLEYEALKRSLRSAAPAEVRRFLETYADTPLAGRLRSAWLSRLARDGRWKSYVAFYEPTDSVVPRCRWLQALIETGRSGEAFAAVPEIWLHGRSRPKECDPALDAWRAAGRLTPELTWQRIELAFQAGEWRLARYLKRFLGPEDRRWAELWLDAHRDPDLLTRRPQAFSGDHPMRNAILEHGLERLADRDPEAALHAWESIDARFDFDSLESTRITRYLTLALAREHHPRALDYLERIEPCSDDLRLHETRIRTALGAGDWGATLSWIEALPPEARDEERWRYWRARALEMLGHRSEAADLYRSLARERSYYGFLAADRAGLEYRLDDIPVPVEPATLQTIAGRPGLRRARELRLLDRLGDARTEWQWAIRDMAAPELKAAAKLAQSWGWHDRAIFTLARTGYWDDLELRFPLEHRADIESLARTASLDPAWVYAVVRQESAFIRDARSGAGALGLMQLMPSTAGYVARKLGERPPGRFDLLDPQINIRLGSTYLKRVYDRLGGHPVLATAAYNAGPRRVESWLPAGRLDADVWIELIPFRETRRYVQRVLTYTAIYEHRLGRAPERLSERMRPVGSAAGWADRAASEKGDAA